MNYGTHGPSQSNVGIVIGTSVSTSALENCTRTENAAGRDVWYIEEIIIIALNSCVELRRFFAFCSTILQ